MANGKQWQAPTGDEMAGLLTYRPPKSPYEQFMQEEEIPVVKGIGVYDTRELELRPWKRLGGRGAFLDLGGLGGVKGMVVVEGPPGGALDPEREMYERVFLGIDGSGDDRGWRGGGQTP